jgi:Fur family ferric uptake transcriptional regulator
MKKEHGGCGRKWQGKFKGCGFKMTVGREAVIDVLSQGGDHLSANEIYKQVRAMNPEIGLTTVYRTLEILNNIAIVTKFDFGDKRARYELKESGKGHHHHLVCTGCGRIVDYDDFINEEIKLLKETEVKLSKKYNFRINDHLIQFYGLCKECKA